MANSTLHDPSPGLTEQILHSFTIDVVPSYSLVFLNVEMFSVACSLPPFPLIMRNDSLESVSLRLFPILFLLLHDSSRWTMILEERFFAFDFNLLRVTLVAILMFVHTRELDTRTFHLLDDSLWVGRRPCGVSEYFGLGVDVPVSIPMIVRYEFLLT